MDFQDPEFQEGLRDIFGIQQRQKLIKLQQEQLEQQRRQTNNRPSAPPPTPKNRQCPWCGGALAGEFEKCCHCGSTVAWVNGFPCKPGQEEVLRNELEREELRKREEEAVRRRAAMYINCTSCNVELLKSAVAVLDPPLCPKCQAIQRQHNKTIFKATLVLLCIVAIGFLSAALYGGQMSQTDRNAVVVILAICIVAPSIIIILPVINALRPMVKAGRNTKAGRDVKADRVTAAVGRVEKVRSIPKTSIAHETKSITCPCGHAISYTPPLPNDGVDCPKCGKTVALPTDSITCSCGCVIPYARPLPSEGLQCPECHKKYSLKAGARK